MTISPWLAYSLGVAATGVVARLWSRYRADVRARRAYQAPLFDPFLLDVALSPRERDGDDPAVLDEVRQTLRHLNRQSFAQEFWTVDTQLTAYYARVPRESRRTLRRAFVRLIGVNDPWLRLLGARACAALCFVEAAPLLEELLAQPSQSTDQAVAARIRAALEAALADLRRQGHGAGKGQTGPAAPSLSEPGPGVA